MFSVFNWRYFHQKQIRFVAAVVRTPLITFACCLLNFDLKTGSPFWREIQILEGKLLTLCLKSSTVLSATEAFCALKKVLHFDPFLTILCQKVGQGVNYLVKNAFIKYHCKIYRRSHLCK